MAIYIFVIIGKWIVVIQTWSFKYSICDNTMGNCALIILCEFYNDFDRNIISVNKIRNV